MLVIRRRAGQSILIGEKIEVEVIDLGPNRVKLGITAPKEISVVRKELQVTRDQNLIAAREPSPTALAKLMRTLRPG